MTDDKRRPPPRFPRLPADDDEIVEVPPTERVPRTPSLRPREPFQKLVTTPSETIADILALVRKQALQLDGFGQLINRRFELFHQELALMRADISELHALVTTNHGPRLDGVESKVEKLTPKQKAKLAGVITAKLGAYGTGALFFGGLALRALGRVYPDYAELIDGILESVGVP